MQTIEGFDHYLFPLVEHPYYIAKKRKSFQDPDDLSAGDSSESHAATVATVKNKKGLNSIRY